MSVKVGRDTFDLSALDIREKGGLLRSVFFEGFKDPRDDQGVFHLKLPHARSSDFQFVSVFYSGELPDYISEETVARLQPMLRYLDLDDMVTALIARTVLPKAPSQPPPRMQLGFMSIENKYIMRRNRPAGIDVFNVPLGWNLHSLKIGSDDTQILCLQKEVPFD